ncbi:hypothetical protein GA707_10905 [Nostocoides sp. F2B08]|uniref:hypothetical protein n=1 Tax=Nostocoides sp. F2B08 TaxID=2653936 RepID=UPI0012636278|nr:hypothetical protein [Tetrasphaera sp. F2B08]KAB7743971.1 hypothetical protein GA707_10905 [Tetrasphaera sp. F2B08]
MSESTGVVFPLVDGRRSTAATGRTIVADALRRVDPIGANATERETNWRAGYLVHFRRLVEAGLPSAEAALTIARDGLASVHTRLQWGDPDAADEPLARAFGHPPAPVATEEVRGTGEREPDLSVPYRGERLRGDALRRQVDAWIAAGVAEPSLADVVGEVIDHPEWLALPDRTVVVLGAAAEMGPLRSLLRWGGTVAAVDLPRPGLWEPLLAEAGETSGRLLVPARPGDRPLAARAGGDLIHDLSTVGSWVAGLDGHLVLGNYVYADGAMNVRVSAAVDALTEHLRRLRPPGEVGMSFLATPTDVFAVPGDAVEASVESHAQRRTSKALRVPLRTLSGGRLLRRNYVPGEDPGINDSVVTQQGPNYLLAKRIQRWRAAVARDEGVPVSFHIAPPTRTRSVVKNRALAAAYAGAHRFGIEVFEPGTSNTLMAALLVHDVMTGPRPSLGHPWVDEAHAAVHGGLWRAAYDPRSALGLAALLGFGASR